VLTPSDATPSTLTPSAPQVAGDDNTPYVLSYAALRQAVGYIAILLPWVVFFGANIDHPWRWQPSISAYYYTDMRNIFVGSLCAISMFQLACRGYKNTLGNLDITGSWLSGALALGVAFFPTEPECPAANPDCATASQKLIGHIHVACAVLLFCTLAGFCLYLFQLSTAAVPSERKFVRNRIFTFCGWAILASMAFVPIGDHVFHHQHARFIGEMASLTFFGFAWLVKGQALFKDQSPPPTGVVSPRIPKRP
jgi:hypothetical protein